MYKIMLSAALLAFGFLSFAQNGKVINDQNAQKRNVASFHAIRVSHGIDLYISQGDDAVAVSATEIEVRNRIKTEVENGVLKIYMDTEGFHWSWGNKKLKAYVSCKTLDNLSASGGSDVFTDGTLKEDKLDISLSGGSDLKGKVDIKDLSLNQTGGSDVDISGTVSNLKVHASGGSDFHGFELSADMCDVDASGGSDAHITVNKELTVNASGGSDVHYKGSGVIRNMHSSGSSSISKKG